MSHINHLFFLCVFPCSLRASGRVVGLLMHTYHLQPFDCIILIIVMHMQRHHPNRSSSRVASRLLFTTIVIVLPYLMFSRCSADEPSRDIFGHRAATMTANDHEAAVSSALGMHSKGNGEKKFARFSSSASAERYATVLVSCRDCFILVFL